MFLLEDHMNISEMLAYKARPVVYGALREDSDNWGCKISWSTERMFKLDMDKLSVDYESIGTVHLTLVKTKDNADSEQDLYINIFFTHNRERQKESCWMPQRCHFYQGKPRAPHLPASYSCQHMMYWT